VTSVTALKARPGVRWAFIPTTTMLYKTLSAAVYGIDAGIIEVEVDVSGIKTSEDHFHTIGLQTPPCARVATGCVPP
jgi:hypothetical protein